MSTSTPPAWNRLEEKYVPVPHPAAFATMADDQYESLALSTDSHNRSESATLGVQTDSPDPTGEDIWPLDRDQCPDCRCAPNMAHSPECDVSSNPVISCDRKDDATDCDGVRFGREGHR